MDFDESRYRKLLQEHIDREVKAANEIIGKKDDAGKQRGRCMMALDELSGKRGVGVMNTWPGGIKKALNQDDHERWNASHYPGTRQICTVCGEPTTFCEEDGYFDDDMQPYCFGCALMHGLRGEW